MSFKYRFILSFVLLEIFFIVLIVTMNFIAITDSSEKLIKQKINSNLSFLDQMIRVPISIYDLASLDNLSETTTKLDYINSIVILDNQDRILSKSYNFKAMNLEDLLFLKKDQTLSFSDHTYEIKLQKIQEDDTVLGSFYIVFDTSENFRFINENKQRTILIIILEILISTYLSYYIGNRLTKALTRLSTVAEEIGESKQSDIPFQNRSDEIGILAKSMNKMQIDLKERREKLKDFTKELKEQKNALIVANKSKDDFLANMSHELKTPLNSINVISSIMMKNTKKDLNEDQVKNLKIINNCGHDLLFLINDVLDISKLEAGELELLNETINLEQTMDNIKEMFTPLMAAKDIEFIYEFDENIGHIYSDEQRIKQVVKNLLSNAVKFAQNGKVKFIVKDEQDHVLVKVEDNGIGIPEEKLENIFDRFKQVDESTTRKYGGSGLGLAICKELTKLLGGEIEVTSKLNEGTCFSVTITKNMDKVDNLKLSSLEKENSLEEKTQEELNNILILHNDPLSFMKLVIELKKQYSVIHSDDILKFLHEYKINKNIKVAIIDTSILSRKDLEKIIVTLPVKFILIYENESDSIDNEKVIKKIKKPFLVEELPDEIIKKEEKQDG